MNTIHLSAFTGTQIFAVEPRELKLTRKYEASEYAFVASDIQLTCIDAQDLHDAVNASEDVSFVVYRDQIPRFRGKFQAEGASYDPEKEEYTFTVLHIVKKIFDQAKARLEINPGGKTYSSDAELRATLTAFDSVIENSLHASGICSVRLNPADFEFANTAGKWTDAYFDFLQTNKNYTLRQYWLDFAQHYRSVLYADDDLDSDGSLILHVVPRRKTPILRTGFDDLIADYNEERKNADYEAVIFPFRTYQGNLSAFHFGEFRNGKLLPWYYPSSGDAVNTSGALDMRVPQGIYKTTSDDIPFRSIPSFALSNDGVTFIGQSPEDYVQRTFAGSILPYKEVKVLYHDPVEVYPLDELAIRGTIAKIQEVEDDLMNDTTQVVGRIYE